MQTEDEIRQALGELATLLIRLGKAVAQQGVTFYDTLYEALCTAAGCDGCVDAMLGAMQKFQIPIMPGITDESFDSCIHCKAAAEAAGVVGDEDHADDCPVITDVWPVQWEDVAGELICGSCSVAFNLGEFYMSLPEVQCLPCVFIGTPA